MIPVIASFSSSHDSTSGADAAMVRARMTWRHHVILAMVIKEEGFWLRGFWCHHVILAMVRARKRLARITQDMPEESNCPGYILPAHSTSKNRLSPHARTRVET